MEGKLLARDPELADALRAAVDRLARGATDPTAALEALRGQLRALLGPEAALDGEIGDALEHAITDFFLGEACLDD